MSGPTNLADIWKARLAAKRQLLAQALSKTPANPAIAPIKQAYIEKLKSAVTARKNWAEAYSSHIKSLHSILVSPPVATGGSGTKRSTGSFGEG